VTRSDSEERKTMTVEETRGRAPSPERDDRSRWVALHVLCVGMLMIVLDATVVNVALPAIQDDLGFSTSSLAWVVNAYLIAFGGLLLLAGRLGDLVGRRRVFLAGLGVFTAASLLCGAAQSQELLVAARFLQGLGGALTSAVILGMIVTLFPEPREQAKAIGAFAFVASAGGAVGLLVGGVLTQSINWHWIFFVNVPVGVVTALLARRLFRSRDVCGANLIQVLSVAGMFGAFFLGALYLQRILDYDALQTGLAFLPVTVIMGTLSVRYTDRLVMRFGARRPVLAGLVLFAGGLALFTRAPVDGNYAVHVLPVMVLLGLGAGVCFPALMTLAMSGATPSDAGLASGLINTTAQVGGALGLAVLATLSASHSAELVADGEPTAAALVGGYHLAFAIGAALVAVAVLVALVVLRPPAAAATPERPEALPACPEAA
jgi:MFS family permease